MAVSSGWKLTPEASAVFGKWYSINGKPASTEDGGVMAARGLPCGGYWVASDFVRQLRTVSEIDPWRRVHIHTAIHKSPPPASGSAAVAIAATAVVGVSLGCRLTGDAVAFITRLENRRTR